MYQKTNNGGRKPGYKPGKPSSKASAKPDKPVISGARMTALRALYDVFYMESYCNLALDKQIKLVRLSDDDKRLATGIFYACVENRMRTDYILSPFIKETPQPIVNCILHIAAAQILYMDRIPPHAAVNEAVNQTRAYKKEECAGFVNGVLRSLLRAKEAGELRLPDEEADREKYLSIMYSCSPFAVKLLTDAYGYDEAKALLSYRQDKGGETLRPNLIRYSDAELESWLTENGFEWEKGMVPHAYRVRRGGNPAQTEAFNQGLFSVQGQSAILAAMALNVKRGMTVLDCCAAPGGKAALIGELMQGSGRVYAWDLHEHRVELIKETAKRLGLDNLRCAVKDACVPKEEINGTMDAVLIDAPCTGLGVMADKPDIKYGLDEKKYADIVRTQKSILDTCSAYVKPGGIMVYSTCSVLPGENQQQVHAFLMAHPEFKTENRADFLPESLKPLYKDGQITLLQSRDGVEGFYIAVLRRV